MSVFVVEQVMNPNPFSGLNHLTKERTTITLSSKVRTKVWFMLGVSKRFGCVLLFWNTAVLAI